MSVLETLESLFDYVFRSVHVELFREQQQWFPPASEPGLALRWIPAGQQPSPTEATDRLALLRAIGDGPFAFGFKTKETLPPVPRDRTSEDPPEEIHDGRIFRTKANTTGGAVGHATLFHCRQRGGRAWATYSGGGVRFGTLVAVADQSNHLDMRYRHLSLENELREGRCRSTPHWQYNPLEVDEVWEWTSGPAGKGRSTLQEA